MIRANASLLPPISHIRRRDTHRLIPAQYSDPLDELAEDAGQVADLAALSDVTDERQIAENNRLPALGTHELVFGVPQSRIVNAAFTYAHPLGSRFNGPDRGAWYAAFQLSTAHKEVSFHKAVHLAEVGRYHDKVEFDDYLADFGGEFHDLRRTKRFRNCLDPRAYVASQELAEKLLESGSLGVVYPSVRRARGTCLVCFDPRSVLNVRRARRYRFCWRGDPNPTITILPASASSAA